jgi:hypothetical protein
MIKHSCTDESLPKNKQYNTKINIKSTYKKHRNLKIDKHKETLNLTLKQIYSELTDIMSNNSALHDLHKKNIMK